MSEKDKPEITRPRYDEIFIKYSNEFPNASDEELHDKTSKAYEFETKTFANLTKEIDGKKYFALSSLVDGAGNFNEVINDSNLYTPQQVLTYVQYAEESEKELREISFKLYNYIQEYKQLINRYSSMMNYYPVVNPTSEVTVDEFIKTLEFFEGYNYKTRLQQITERVLKQDVFFGYDITQNGSVKKILKEMPYNYCKLIGRDKHGVYLYKFDLGYFDKFDEQINSFPVEFERAYKRYKNNKTVFNRWFEPDNTKQFAFKFDTTVNYPLPYFTGVFVDLVRLQEVKTAQTIASKVENYKLVHFKIPINEKEGKADDYLISPDDATEYLRKANENMPIGIGAVINPFDITVSSMKNGNDNGNNIVDRHFSNLLSSAGMSELLSSKRTSGSTGFQGSVEADEALMFKLLRQYEAFFTRQVKFSRVKGSYSVKFINSSIHNQDKVFEKYLKAAQNGLNRFYVSSSAGISQLEAIYGRTIEKELDLDELFNPMQSAHTLSGNDGNDEKNDSDLSDEGDRTRDKE